MKKMFVTLLALSMAAGVFANGSKETAPAQAAEEKPMTQEEIIAAAKQEGDLTIYTPSSRHSQMGEQFGAQYGLKVTTTQLKDIEMVEKVSQEAKANLDGADVVFAQDGARVYPELIATGYVTSYTPDDLKSKIPAMYQNPQVWDLCVKAFVYNNETAGQPITNVWQLTEPEWSGRVQMKDAYSEAVNMNFFTMITRDDWAKKISDAYKHLYGKDLVLDKDSPNAGYQWIKAMYKNGMVLGKSDTTIAENIGAKGQATQLVGLFTKNKLRNAASKNLALAPCYKVEPFSGFYYPIYCFIPSNSRSVNAAKLFIQYNLGPEGWKAFNKGIGDYSPNPDNVNQFDPVSLEEWGNMLVFEDPAWCAEHRPEVEEFVSKL